MKGKLYLVSTPIGNYDDITLRALKVLRQTDIIICEELKEARRLLAHHKIEKDLFPLNEHNEKDESDELLMKLLEGKSASLISDCGTPLFSDPGRLLVDLCISQKIEVIPVPGASSLLPALIGSGFDTEKFYYYGWLSPKKDERRQQLFHLKRINELVVLMDTPYRLKSLLADVVKVLGKSVPAAIGFELTKERERFLRGTADNLLQKAEKENLKGEFVLLLNLRGYSKMSEKGR